MRSDFKGHVRNTGAFFFRKMLLQFFALSITMTAIAQSEPCTSPVERKEINITEIFQQIEVKGEISVILTSGPAGEIVLEGSANDISTVKVAVKQGRLIIDAEKKKNCRLTVFVSVTNVTGLLIKRDATLFSFGKISVREL